MNQDEVYFSINEVAKQIDVVPATIRNWEKQGLFTSKRTKKGYRIFDFHDIEYLSKIKQYSKVDNMGINAIKLLLGESKTPKADVTVSKKLLGKKWKEYRQQKGYLLEDIANEVGISPSYLSKIENAQANVSLEVLSRLAEFYGENLLYYVNKVTEESHLVKKGMGDKFTIGVEGILVEDVVSLGNNAISSMIYTVDPGCGRLENSVHSGFEFIHVLSGTIKMILNEDDEYRLSVGDSMSYWATDNHRWYNCGKKPARLLWAYTATEPE